MPQPGSDCPFSAPILTADKGEAVNWRQTIQKIVKRAGVELWPKLFQALRATRETELAAVLPLHVVTACCGNTPTLALRHYLMMTDEHHQQAASLDVSPDSTASSAARNPTRYTSELGSTGGSAKKEPLEIPGNSEGFHLVPIAECPGEDSNLHGK
ncbi:MAG: hypothetical protein ACYTGL_18045 [Planctomycetota bacterium]